MAVTWWMPSGFVFISLTPFPSVYCIPLSSVDDLAPEDPQSCVDAICPAAGQEQSACNGYEDQVELVKAACGEEAVLQVHLDYRDDHHHAEGQRRQRRQEARYHQYPADELRQLGQDAIGLVGFVPSRSWDNAGASIPGPPQLPKSFWAPWATKTPPNTSLRTNSLMSSIPQNLLCIYPHLSAVSLLPYATHSDSSFVG